MIELLYFLGQCILILTGTSALIDQPVETLNHTYRDTIEYKILKSYDDLDQLISEADDESMLVVNLWATWCAPCIKELPYFEDYYAQNKEQNVRVILVSLDFPRNIKSRFVPFIEKQQLKSELYLLDDPNENEWIDIVDPSWSGTIPATIFIKGKKRIFTDQEMHSVRDIESYIKKLK